MLVKLAFVMQRLKKYLKNVVMINKDGGGQFLDFMGGHNCYERDMLMGGLSSPLHSGKPWVSKMRYMFWIKYLFLAQHIFVLNSVYIITYSCKAMEM